MMGYIIALISGTLMSVQGVFNTEVTKAAGMWVTNGWVQITAFLACLAAWFFSGRDNIGNLFQVDHKYMLAGGIIGAFITYTVIKSIGSLGPAKAALLIVIAQLAVAYLIEVFGMFGVEKVEFSWQKLVGMAVAIIGFIIFKWK
ncbi:MAG: DMT family transporter [Lachnospiraceae bacterium]